MARKKKQRSILKFLSERIPVLMGNPASVVIHTIFFIGIFVLRFFDYTIDQIMLILTTAVSLEAIYLSLFIQMSVNKTTESLEDVEKDIDEIQEDVEDITEDIDEVQEDVEDITEDIQKSNKTSPTIHTSAKQLADFMLKMEADLSYIKKEITDLKEKK